MKKYLFQFLLKATFICVLINLTINIVTCLFNNNKSPWIKASDIDSDIEQIVTRNGYIFENHTVITDDGYILELHRLHMDSQHQHLSDVSRPVVFFMHGCLQSSIGWLTAGVKNSLPFHLADGGYDVWLGNARGNRYARRHTRIDPDRNPKAFFDFSWHEIGYYDLTTSIDYIINNTGSDQVHFVSHSQGGAALYVMLSERPEYNQKIRSSIALSPAVFVKHGFAPSMMLLSKAPLFFEWMFDKLNIHEIFRFSELTAIISRTICHDQSALQPICSFVVGISCGFNYKELNTTALPELFSYGPAGASWKQLFHYAQIKRADKFQKYDKGPKWNSKHYGQSEPTEYNLTNVNVPTALFYSDNDWAIHEKDFVKLSKTLPNIFFVHKQIGYAHMDFLMGKTNVQIFKTIDQLLLRY